ncbi:hypothetical protein DM860_009549 [Cuscuta australis]|uniref:Uncharacterized protein n=1 Tax=Cuscuta australis TaxID=267555 RepID=A0A328DIR4_9ASTE|nr:hypothetical protein DM860_009549 [Cuscuta australis]
MEGEGFYEEELEGDGGVVSVVFAIVADAAWARVCINGLQNMRVYGCIKASRETVGEQSEFVMFTRSLENHVHVGPDGFFPLDGTVVVASKRARLTISLSLNLCSDDGKWCVLQKDLVFDAVFRKEAQTIQDDVFGGEVTVSLAYKDGPDLDCDDDNEDESGYLVQSLMKWRSFHSNTLLLSA